MVQAEKHLMEMLKINKEIYESRSWKRKKDLRRHLAKLEKQWNLYQGLNYEKVSKV